MTGPPRSPDDTARDYSTTCECGRTVEVRAPSRPRRTGERASWTPSGEAQAGVHVRCGACERIHWATTEGDA